MKDYIEVRCQIKGLSCGKSSRAHGNLSVATDIGHAFMHSGLATHVPIRAVGAHKTMKLNLKRQAQFFGS